jgi:hypothetical protein
VRLSAPGLEDYVSRIAFQLERYGVALDLDADETVVIEESPSGTLSLDLRGFLPDGRQPPLSEVAVREKWRPLGTETYERWEYDYELLDHERRFRRAFHLHDADTFLRHFSVAVHEHCEVPVGQSPCEHFAGLPIRDGYRAVEVLLGVWTSPTLPDCATMTCLE